jgi:serine/threonine protein phosphatase PrpC
LSKNGDDKNSERLIMKKINEDSSEVKVIPFLDGEIGFFTHKSPYKESVNEDCLGFIELDDHCGVMAVADGIGGQRSGYMASKIAIETIVTELDKFKGNPREELRETLLNAIDTAHAEIKKLGVGAGTTLVVAEMVDNNVRFYNLGDSIGYHLGGKGKLKFKTLEQSPIGYAVESGLLDEQEAMTHEDKNLISHALGLDPMRIDISLPMEVSQRDSVFLASDGVSDNLSSDEISDIFSSGEIKERFDDGLKIAGERMEQPDDGLGKADDLAMILYRRTK